MASETIHTCDHCGKRMDYPRRIFFGYTEGWGERKEKHFEAGVCEKCKWEIRDKIVAMVKQMKRGK